MVLDGVYVNKHALARNHNPSTYLPQGMTMNVIPGSERGQTGHPQSDGYFMLCQALKQSLMLPQRILALSQMKFKLSQEDYSGRQTIEVAANALQSSGQKNTK